jgi:hypothetical protein
MKWILAAADLSVRSNRAFPRAPALTEERGPGLDAVRVIDNCLFANIPRPHGQAWLGSMNHLSRLPSAATCNA